MTDQGRSLVEPEGVNSGSAKDLMGGAEADARPGGNPSRSGQAEAAPSGPTVVQPPWDEHDEDAPSLEQSREEGAR
jgi:hypothetical protein